MGDLSKPRKYEESHQRDHHTPLLDNTNEIENSEKIFAVCQLKRFFNTFYFYNIIKVYIFILFSNKRCKIFINIFL